MFEEDDEENNKDSEAIEVSSHQFKQKIDSIYNQELDELS